MIIEFNLPFNSDFVIVDNEISNDISSESSFDWNYEKADISCSGFLFKDKIKIFMREKKDDPDKFKILVKKELDKYDCLYAFNRNMEFGNFKGYIGKEYDIREIKAFKGKGWSKQKFFEKLINDKKIEEKEIPNDPLKDSSEACISCYEKEDYESIITHNKADLIKQALLMKHKDYLIDKYKDKIDKNGWLR